MKSLTITLLFCVLSLSAAFAQTYHFSQFSGSYSDLTGSTPLTTEVWDDPQAIIPIGFNFTFYDSTISEIYLDDWGLGGELTLDTSETGTYGILIPYGADIMDRGYKFTAGGSPTSQSTISYRLEGTSGSRVLKIEWNNVGFYSEIEADDLSTDYTNFQLWLFEGSNNIEMHFGPNSITQPSLCFEGATGTYIGMFPEYDFDNLETTLNGVELSGNPQSPTVSSTNEIYVNYMGGVIPNGTIYKFSKSAATLQDFEQNQSIFEVLPNPAHNQITITLNDEKEHIRSVEILNTTGQVVLSTNTILHPIDISELSAGIYIVNVSSESAVFTSRLMKK